MSYQLYWGDLHSHCSISYGHGTLPQALAKARQQLDFCSVTGHAFWPVQDNRQTRERRGHLPPRSRTEEWPMGLVTLIWAER